MSEDTGTEAAPEVSAEESVAAAVAPPSTDAAWHWSEGNPGEGDAPEWFKGDKYKSVDEQAKAYTELESKFGSFSGAPDDYTVNVSEELTERGIEIAEDDPILEEAFKMGKDMGMSQDGMNRMIEVYAMTEIAKDEASQQNIVDQMGLLGDNAEQRVGNLDMWAQANLPTDLYDGFVDSAQSASSVKALEHLISMTRAASVSPDAAKAAPGMSALDVKNMQFEKDTNGNRRIQTDPDFKAKYEAAANAVYGEHDHRIVVGGG